MDEDYAISGPPDISEADFTTALQDAASPAAGEAVSMYQALVAGGVRPLVFLAFFRHESKFGAKGIAADFQTCNPGNVRRPWRDDLGATIIETPRGRFAKYLTWTDGVADWAARLQGSLYAGASLTTVRSVIPRYAPESDGNVPTSYIRSVLEFIHANRGKVDRLPGIEPCLTPINHWKGRDGRGIRALVIHVTQGSEPGTTSWFQNPRSEVSAHYLVCKDGRVLQYVLDEDTAWANGNLNRPDLTSALVKAWHDTGTNPNRETLSIETERFADQPLTEAQRQALLSLIRLLCTHHAIPMDRAHILGHNQLDSVDRPNCPSLDLDALVADLASLATATVDSSDRLLESTFQARGAEGGCGRKRFKGRLQRDFYAGDVLVCDRAVLTVDGRDLLPHVMDDWQNLQFESQTLQRF